MGIVHGEVLKMQQFKEIQGALFQQERGLCFLIEHSVPGGLQHRVEGCGIRDRSPK